MPVTWKRTELDEMDCMLREAWEHNALHMNEVSGRPLAHADGDDLDGDGNRGERITVSETVGYKLFMELLMATMARTSGDAELETRAMENFDRAWGWAERNMQRSALASAYDPVAGALVPIPEGKRDSLLAWRYVPGAGVIHHAKNRSDGIFIDGLDGAPDGDLFTAASLRLAAVLWPERQDYLAAAEDIAVDIRAKYVAEIGGEPYLLGGDEFVRISGINPSYSFEAVYDMMGELDPSHAADWQRLKQSSMKAAVAGADSTLSAGGPYMSNGRTIGFRARRIEGSSNMPPNWLTYDGSGFGDNEWFDPIDWISGWDGLRTLWMKAAYFLYDGNEAARRYLQDDAGTKEDFGPYGFLKNHLLKHGRLPAGFGIDGSSSGPELSVMNLTEPNAFSLGIYLGFFYAAGDIEAASRMLGGLVDSYHTQQVPGPIGIGEGTFAEVRTEGDLDYFGDCWAWFGMAMARGAVEDLFGLYREWRAENVMPPASPAPLLPSYFEVKPGGMEFARGMDLMKSNMWISAFDGCSRKLFGGYACEGRAKEWYLGGVGIGLGRNPAWGIEREYDGLFIDAPGAQGRVKIELHTDRRIYVHEASASNAASMYVPFTAFREEIDYAPKGRSFDPKVDRVGKIQVIGLGATADGEVEFVLKEIRAVKK
ncbi:MAG: hypothetical protein JXA24_06545 [Proteobacteria bacterium]|nr:hypothetical protein [Pseudomonadota bacterium]